MTNPFQRVWQSASRLLSPRSRYLSAAAESQEIEHRNLNMAEFFASKGDDDLTEQEAEMCLQLLERDQRQDSLTSAVAAASTATWSQDTPILQFNVGTTSATHPQPRRFNANDIVQLENTTNTSLHRNEIEKSHIKRRPIRARPKLTVSSARDTRSWRCNRCFVLNGAARSCCLCCGNLPTKASITSSNGASLESTAKPPVPLIPLTAAPPTESTEKDWICSTCLVSNKALAKICICCDTNRTTQNIAFEKHSKNESVSNESPIIPVSIQKSDTLSIPSNLNNLAEKWQCTQCLVNNTAEKQNCICCESPRFAPATKPAAKSSVNTSNSWQCSQCLVNNPSEKSLCVCCEAPKPGAQKKKEDTATVPIAIVPVAKTASWTCSSCLVSNSSTATLCVCCEAPRPNGNLTSLVIDEDFTWPSIELGSWNKEIAHHVGQLPLNILPEFAFEI